MTDAWSYYVIALTTITIIGVTWLLMGNRTKPSSSQETTGHKHDGIEEYDNPLPAWWFYLYIGSIVFAIGYLVIFPGMGNYPGLIGWTSADKWEREEQRAKEKYGEVFARYREMPIEELHQQRQAMKMAQRIFANNCSQCHGVDAKGGSGFPDLSDHDWLYGGTPKQIKLSINRGRNGVMPAWGESLGDEVVTSVTHYVSSLSHNNLSQSRLSQSKESSDASTEDKFRPELVEAGKQSFKTYCSACHGMDATGNTMLGAPNLADSIWLYGGSIAEIKESIFHGQNGVMPAHEETINADKIHLLSAYVYGLSRRDS